VPEATLHPAEKQAHPGAVHRTLSAASQPPHPDRHARQIEPRGNVPDNELKGEARVKRSFSLGLRSKKTGGCVSKGVILESAASFSHSLRTVTLP